MVITGDLLKLVYLGIYPPSDIWWCQLILKHIRFTSVRYASYWNAVLYLYSCNVCSSTVVHNAVSLFIDVKADEWFRENQDVLIYHMEITIKGVSVTRVMV